MKTLHSLLKIDTKIGELGVTFRRGTKWFHEVAPTDEIALCVCTPEHKIEGKGKIEFTRIYHFKDIPIQFLKNTHLRSSQTYEGLLNNMRKAYPDFNEDEHVTVVGYRRIE